MKIGLVLVFCLLVFAHGQRYSNEEFKQSMQTLFDPLDVDKNGYIEATEYETLVKQWNAGSPTTEEEYKGAAARFITMFDQDGDGIVNFHDFYVTQVKWEDYDEV